MHPIFFNFFLVFGHVVRPCLGLGGHQRPSHRGVRGGRRAGHWFQVTGATKATGHSLAAGSVWNEGGARFLHGILQ